MNQPCILVVASDLEERRQISALLDDAGYDDVMSCPGPGEPDYTCLGSRGDNACPLSNAADIVVLDLRLRSDEMMQGTPGWQLMLSYYGQGKKIVAISGAEDVVQFWDVLFRAEPHVAVVERPYRREQLLYAIRSVASVAAADRVAMVPASSRPRGVRPRVRCRVH